MLKRRALAATVMVCAALGSPAVSAQQGEVMDAVVEGLPTSFRHAEATARGDLLLALGPEAEAPMMQIIALRSAFQRELLKFGQARWGERGVDHVVEGADRSVWAIGAREVLTRASATGPWRRIELEQLEARACQEWEQYGTHCQEIIPLGGGRGIVLRPAYGAGADGEVVLGTQVVVVAADQDRELGAISLPGILLGPSVSDAKGGFWVMIRRPQKLSTSYKPLRGYLHFNAEGGWEMWNGSKEQLEDVEYKGVAAFEINPEPRKMAPDGEGGFFAIGRDRQLHHVDEAGQASVFGPAQLRCQYCQPLAVAWDSQARELHLLSAQWRDGSGRRQLYEGLRWWRLDSRGQIISQTMVPGAAQGEDALFDQVAVRANNGSAWILGPKLWMHHDGRVWTRLTSGAASRDAIGASGQTKATTQDATQQSSQADAALYALGLTGGIMLAGAGVIGGYALAPDDERSAAAYPWLFGMLGAYYPAAIALPAVSSGSSQPTNWGCLGGGFAGMTALTGLAVWGSGELFAKQAYGEDYAMEKRRIPGAFGGAALGSLAAFGMAKLMYGDQPDPDKDAWVILLGTALTSSASMLGYYMFASSPVEEETLVIEAGALRQPLAPPPMLGTSFGFSW